MIESSAFFHPEHCCYKTIIIFVLLLKAERSLAKMKRPDILHHIAEAMRNIAPTAQTIVYGSEARGDARPDSDIDLLILLDDQEELTPERELELRRPLSELEAQTGVAINALVVLRRVWEQLISPFTINVTREGIAL